MGKKEEGGLGRGKGRKHLPQAPHIPPVNYNSRSSGERKFPLVDTSPRCHFRNMKSHSGIVCGFILTTSALSEVTTQKNDSRSTDSTLLLYVGRKQNVGSLRQAFLPFPLPSPPPLFFLRLALFPFSPPFNAYNAATQAMYVITRGNHTTMSAIWN